MSRPDPADRPIAEALRAAMLNAAVMAALLLLPAGLVPGGSWIWPRGIALVTAFGGIQLGGSLALATWRPASFRIRRQSVIAARGKGQPLLDAIGSAALLAVGACWLVFMALDVFRLHLLPAPGAAVVVAGGLLAVVGLALTPLAVWENRFATPNVQDQTDAGQQVVSTGVYRLVRHPIYLGNLMYAVGAALWLGSYAGLGCAAILLVMTVGRLVIEEKDLNARLPAYAEYARRVRGRLIPFML